MIEKLYRSLIVTLIIFGFTGCTADATLKFDKNNNVKQTIKISENVKLLDEFKISYKKYIDEKIDYAKANNNKYMRNDFRDDTTFGTVYTKESNDICKELKTSYFTNFFETIKCEAHDDYYDISAKTSYIYCPPDASYCSDAKEVKLSLELPEKAIDDDADYIEGNKYTWVYDSSKIGSLNVKIKRYKENIIKKVSSDKKLSSISLIAIVILIVGLTVAVLFKKYKKNRIEY